MPKKNAPRKFNYYFSDNTEEENYRIKKEFTIMIKEFFFTKIKGMGIWDSIIFSIIFALIIIIVFYFTHR